MVSYRQKVGRLHVFFLKRTGRRAAYYIKKEKTKDDHNSTVQGALVRYAPKVKYTQKRSRNYKVTLKYLPTHYIMHSESHPHAALKCLPRARFITTTKKDNAPLD
jgi:hypothetical protein